MLLDISGSLKLTKEFIPLNKKEANLTFAGYK
jgi:hypothetical protein